MWSGAAMSVHRRAVSVCVAMPMPRGSRAETMRTARPPWQGKMRCQAPRRRIDLRPGMGPGPQAVGVALRIGLRRRERRRHRAARRIRPVTVRAAAVRTIAIRSVAIRTVPARAAAVRRTRWASKGPGVRHEARHARGRIRDAEPHARKPVQRTRLRSFTASCQRHAAAALAGGRRSRLPGWCRLPAAGLRSGICSRHARARHEQEHRCEQRGEPAPLKLNSHREALPFPRLPPAVRCRKEHFSPLQCSRKNHTMQEKSTAVFPVVRRQSMTFLPDVRRLPRRPICS